MRKTALALVVLSALVLAGCVSGSGARGTSLARDLPRLPDNPDPTKKYCKVWVPAKTRMVPKLVKVCGSSMKTETVKVMKTTARDVMVEGPQERQVDPCCPTCTDTLVQAKPGGYRWECDGECWQYKYRAPEYKWCSKTVKEKKIAYCYTTPAKYETVVETRQVCRPRQTYVPPKYETKWVEEVYEPGHWEWRAGQSCGTGNNDCRTWSPKHVYESDCGGCPKPAKALDCGCPTTN